MNVCKAGFPFQPHPTLVTRRIQAYIEPLSMLTQLIEQTPRLKKRWHRYEHLFADISVPARVTLLDIGQVARKLFFVREGSLRAFFRHRGKEITFQFFFEGDAVASIDSFRSGEPSPIGIKTVEPSTLLVLQRSGFETLLREVPEVKDILLEVAFRRFSDYARLFHAYIRDSPEQRYTALMEENPRVIQRIPQQYIASFLGITPVSLSRIRRRLTPQSRPRRR